MVKTFLLELSQGFSDPEYVEKILSGQKLIMYENLKIKCISIIDGDFIKSVFLQCASHLNHDSGFQLPETIFENVELKIFTKIMSRILTELNELCFIDQHNGYLYSNFLKIYPINSSQAPKGIRQSKCLSNYIYLSNILSVNQDSDRIPFPALLKRFILMYELKFIYGNTSSKLNQLTQHF
ncbi:hypothetical protein RF11_07684 [Thelohanellus kitauei]|uniref:Uncharacterized protein n=1 Tax=Thelohanellus kitauei TaxID=669202 RepID=A0A0C2IHH1_THEKT|nr:hypothetical protein RF11_07684 [Thelohanellus kitauei]